MSHRGAALQQTWQHATPRSSPAPANAVSDSKPVPAPPVDSLTSAPREQPEWVPVRHESGQVYYWNKNTGVTTQLGAPDPEQAPPGSFIGGLLGLVAAGAGIGLTFSIIGRLF
ncbi:hypothetical protein WJX81_003925 [Elliptochloris bilobata]|uniref:WW domain-containing protein n=1 Tax=Elliptochloris bilobata TaxID=381761 RepID=A0AAW1RM28_9CHLO